MYRFNWRRIAEIGCDLNMIIPLAIKVGTDGLSFKRQQLFDLTTIEKRNSCSFVRYGSFVGAHVLSEIRTRKELNIFFSIKGQKKHKK